MSYRNGTYIAFHANNTTDPTESDIKYYNLLKSWDANSSCNFQFIDSHDKAGAVRDSSKKITLERVLKERLNNSKNLLLIIGKTTKEDRDWIPLEISYAVDHCYLPIIAAYIGYNYILAPAALSDLWPSSLATRIHSSSAMVIHIPFREKTITCAINQFDFNNYPSGGLNYYNKDSYDNWGYLI